MSTHTPGPWAPRPSRLDQIGANDRTICSLFAHATKPIKARNNRTMLCPVFDEQDKADARLIKAAPDLLAVAKMFSQYLTDNGGDEEYHNADGTGWLTIVRATIAKAEGTS